MKKLIIFNILLIFTFLSVGIISYGVTEDLYYDLEIQDNYTYNLDTGKFEYDIRYAVSNRINLLDLELQVENNTFHHIIVFGNQNSYLGYYNSIYSNYENDKYLGEFSTLEELPEGSKSFAIIIYKSLNNVPIAELNDLTLNEFFLDYNEYSDAEITGVGDFVPVNVSQNTVTYDDGEIVLTGLDGSFIYISMFNAGSLTATDSYFTVQRLYVEENTVTPIQVRNNVVLDGSININGYGIYYKTITGVTSSNISIFYLSDTFGDELARLDFLYTINLTDAGVSGLTDAKLYEYFLEWKYNQDANLTYDEDLNGLTLNEVFENGNLLINYDFSNGKNGWGDSNNIGVVNDNILQSTALAQFNNIIQDVLFQGELQEMYLYARFNLYSNNQRIYINDGVTQSNIPISIYNEWHEQSYEYITSVGSIRTRVSLQDNEITPYGTNYFDYFYLINKTSLGIENLTKEQMDDYYDTYSTNQTQEYYTLFLQLTSFDLINPYVTREEVEEIPTDPDSLIDGVLDDGGINDDESRFLIALGVVLTIVIVLALLKASFIIILIAGIIPVAVFSFMGWFPLWINIFIVLAGLGLGVKSFIGGGSSD